MSIVDITDIPFNIDEEVDEAALLGPSTSAAEPHTESSSDSNTTDEDDDDSETGEEHVADSFPEKKGKIKKYFKKESSKLSPHLKGLMGEANLRYARGDLETSKKMCFEVIRQSPDAYEPYLTLAQMYETTNLRKYKGYLMLAAHLASSNISIWSRLAEVYQQEGNSIDAIRCYSKGIKFEPKNMWLHKKRLELLEQRVDKRMALGCKQTMANNMPKRQHGAMINLVMDIAKEHFKAKNYIRAIEALKIPIRRIPQHITKDLINMILELLIISERYSECLDIFTQFCGFTFDIIITQEQSLIVDSYIIPENLQVDLKIKFIICLIRLRSSALIPTLINNMIVEDDVEIVGDLYLDVVEALMQSGYPEEAIKLLIPMVKSKNFSLAGVWLKYAECLSSCHMPEQAVEAYFTVMALAPSHVEVLYPLAMLLLQQNKRKEALEVLSQDLSTNKLDVVVLIEQMKLLRQIDDWVSYWKCAELLLSRHCIVLRNPEELKIVLLQSTVREKITKIKKMRNFRSEHSEVEMNFESLREPSVEDEYKLYREILQCAKDREEYAILQKFAFMGLCSKRFNKYFDEVFICAFYACVLNNDAYHGYSIVRELVIKRPDNTLCWNWFSLIIQTPDDVRHSRFIEHYQDRIPADRSELVAANYDVASGNYIAALNYFMRTFKQTKSQFASFMLGVVMLQLYMQRHMDRNKKKVVAETVTYLFLKYAKQREKHAAQEVFYNLGRMYQQLGITYLAEHYYKRVFEVRNELLDKYPEIMCLQREAAYNLHHIYRNSGNLIAARKVLMEHIVI